MVQKLPAKLPRNLVPNPDGQPRVDPVTVDPQNRGRNRNRMNEAENNETKFQQKLHFSKNFFLSFWTSSSKTCDKFYFLTILFILSSFNFDCFQVVVVFETNQSNLKSLLILLILQQKITLSHIILKNLSISREQESFLEISVTLERFFSRRDSTREWRLIVN